jgi:hypothetical protein
MRETMRKIMTKKFNEIFTINVRGQRTIDRNKLQLFLKTLEEPYMQVANKHLKGIRLKNSGKPYYLARFSLERLPWHWLRDDAILAIKKNHWINPGRAQLLKTLGIYTASYLSRHNKNWLKNIRPEDQDEKIDIEHKERGKIIAQKYPQVFNIMKQNQWNELKYF